MPIDLSGIDTEQRNPRTMHIDEASTLEMVQLINDEDHRVAEAVKAVLPQIANAADVIYDKLKAGGRLVYIGCGTSGRLGVLDAAECPPTFGVDYDTVIGLMAGGEKAFVRAVEGAEDDAELGREDLAHISFSQKDALVGIAASGRTPYVIGAMDYARTLGAPVMAITCSHNSEVSRHADITIAPLPGPEVLTGSSRMKSGTAQKLVLNTLSTCVMIKLGKAYQNLMVDVKCSNEKLRQRAISIVCESAGVSEAEAKSALEACDHSCKTAIVSLLTHLSPMEARQALEKADGHISPAVEMWRDAQ